MNKKKKRGLAFIVLFVLIVTMMPVEWGTITASAEQMTKDTQVTWKNATYGNGSSKSKDKITGSASNGSVTIDSKSGKIVPGSTDGLSFHYTAVPAGTNFTLKAKVTVHSWKLSNGQEGFGLMATDWVGEHGGLCWTNSYMLGASKFEYYIDRETKEVTTNTSAAKITQKIGVLGQEKKGVTSENIAQLEANDTEIVKRDFKQSFVPMDYTKGHLYALDSKGNIISTMNTIANAEEAVAGTIENPMTEMYLTIQKNNTGYFLTFSDMNGNEHVQKYYDPSALEKVDSKYVYVGFYAARNAKVTFSDISFETILASEDKPVEEHPIEKVDVVTSVMSSSYTNVSAYELLFKANCDGVVSAADKDGSAIATNVEVKAGKVTTVGNVELNKGVNEFHFVFTPDRTYKPNGVYSEMTSYEPVEKSHKVTYITYGQTGQSIYVAPDAREDGVGSEENPMTIYNAVKGVQPGQQIIIKEGTYKISKTITVERGMNGTSEQPIVMMADTNAKTRPVFDCQHSCTGMVFAGNYWYIKGFDVTRSKDMQKGVQISGSNNVLDQVNAYNNGNTGIQICRYLSTDEFDLWPADNLILNCTSYNNADAGYEDADGFAAKLTVGNGNVFDGCISHHNADDGWDLFAKVQSGCIGAVTIKNCVAYKNGYVIKDADGNLDINGGHEIDAGNGNGFKMGGDNMSGYHVLENSVAYDNKAKGIDSNSCPDIQVKSSLTYNNAASNIAFYTKNAPNTDFAMKYTISYRQGTDIGETISPKGTQDKTKYDNSTNYLWKWSSGSNTHNSADSKLAVNTWFVSLDTAKEVTRNQDGTINLGDLFKFTDKVPAQLKENGYNNAKGTASAVFEKLPAITDSDVPTNVKYGDVNSDGEINSSDAVILKKHLAMQQVQLDMTAADVNCDGSVNVQDAVLLLKYLANMNVSLGK